MKKIICLLFIMAVGDNVFAQKTKKIQEVTDTSDTKILVSTPKRFYMGNGYDFFMFSSAILSKPGQSTKLTTLRFTGVVNLGLNFHYDPNKHLGFFTGISLKNLGLIDKWTDPITGKKTTSKNRVYTIGVPLGIKVGDMRNRNFVFAGGGIDIPFNYRIKNFTEGNRYNKEYKNSEWFSDKTARIMPYIFVGGSIDPGIIIKAQYYPSNFFNEDYVGPSNTKPYAGYKANIFSLSLSVDIHYNQYKIQEREYRKWKAEQDAMKN